MKDNINALENEISKNNLSKERIGKYKHYYLLLKKDLRRFEEAIDEINYGNEERDTNKGKKTAKDEALDLLDVDGNVKKNQPQQVGNEKEVDLLELDVNINDLDIITNDVPVQQTQTEPVEDNLNLLELVQQPLIFKQNDAFDFLSDKPSDENFIKIQK